MGSEQEQPTIRPADSRLFKPIKVGRVTLQSRIVMAPLTRYRNSDDHVPLDMTAEYYSQRGCVPGTLIISEATGVAAPGEGHRNGPGIGSSEAQVAGWRKVTDAVHAKGSFYFQQLWGMGRSADPTYLAERGFDFVSSSAVPMKEGAPTPRAMTEAEILTFIEQFVAAAKKAVAAGADGIEVHGAHGYLLDQFLSDQVNQRTDGWGGSIEKRARLLLEVVRQVSEAIGADRVGLRLSPYAGFQSAQKTDIEGTYKYVLAELKKLPQPLAYLSLVESRGDPEVLVLGVPQINKGRTLDFILEAWDNFSPVIVAGAYTPESAAAAVEGHYAKWDVLVAFGRLFIANPDLVYRIKHGLPLNAYNRATFYVAKSEVGYTDYPFSEEFLAEQKAKSQ